MADFDRQWWKDNQTGCLLILILLVLVGILFVGCAVVVGSQLPTSGS